uniref:Transposase n=1 Tax=Parastrongyloides trichosuri TaxID=131310 RepID=A0A0N5A0A1_PARTI
MSGCRDHANPPPLRPQIRRSLPAPFLVHADQRQRLIALRLENPALGGDIAFHPAVAVQMVRRHIGQDRHVRREARRQIQLIGRHLDHIDRIRRRLRQGQNPDADIAADVDAEARPFQHPADQGRGRRLAVGAGDGDHARPLPRRQGGQRPREQLHIADDRHARLMGALDGPVRLGMGQRRARRQHQSRESRPVGPRQILDQEAFRLGLHPARDAVVPQHGDGPARLKRARRRDPRPSQAEDRDTTPLEAGNGDHRLNAASAWTGRAAPAWRRRSRSG